MFSDKSLAPKHLFHSNHAFVTGSLQEKKANKDFPRFREFEEQEMRPFRQQAKFRHRMDGGCLRSQAGWGAENQEQHRPLRPRCQGKDPQTRRAKGEENRRQVRLGRFHRLNRVSNERGRYDTLLETRFKQHKEGAMGSHSNFNKEKC